MFSGWRESVDFEIDDFGCIVSVIDVGKEELMYCVSILLLVGVNVYSYIF